MTYGVWKNTRFPANALKKIAIEKKIEYSTLLKLLFIIKKKAIQEMWIIIDHDKHKGLPPPLPPCGEKCVDGK